MSALIAAAMLAAAEAPAWRCRNDVEVTCAEGKCQASAPGEFTPLDITARASGGLTVCAYSGCWTSNTRATVRANRALWTAENAAWSGGPEENARVTLLIDRFDGAGFVRVASFATPLVCRFE